MREFRLIAFAALMMCGPSVCFAAAKDDGGDGGGGGGAPDKDKAAADAAKAATPAVDPKVAEQAAADAKELAELRKGKIASDKELAELRAEKDEREKAEAERAEIFDDGDDALGDGPTGSTLFSDTVAVGDEAVPAHHITGAALEMSGLSVEEWNALGQTEIDKRLNGVLEAMNAAWRAANGASGAVVFDPLKPGTATLRMAQAVTVHNYEDGKAPQPYSLKHGLNHDVPAWVANHEFVQENLDRS